MTLRPLLAAASAFAVALLAAPLLIGAPDAPAGEDGAPLAALSKSQSPFGRPTWRVGDAWNVKFGDGEPVCWIVVVSATEEGYRQGVWCASDDAPFIAAQIAGYGIRYMGNLTRDLEGRGEDETTRFYDWPLEDGKTWTTSYYGTPVEVTATYVPETATKPGRWDLSMHDGDYEIVSYDYDPRMGWWSEMRFDGGFTVRTLDAVSGFPRGATYGDARTAYDGTRFPIALDGNVRPTFDVAEDEPMVLVWPQRSGVYAHWLAVYDGNGAPVYGPALVQGNLFLSPDGNSQIVTGAPGSWSIENVAATTSEIRVLVRPIRLSEWTPPGR